MRKIIALWSFTLLASLIVSISVAQAAVSSQNVEGRIFARQMSAPPQAAHAKSWKSRDEYDAFNAMANEKDPNKKIQLAEAFLQKYQNSDFKDLVDVQEMQTYQQLNQPDKAMDAARKALQVDPDNLDALRYLSFVFPFVYKPDAPDAATKLTEAETNAKHGLELINKIQKPANVPEDQFNQAIKGLRAVFNGTVGFVALQRKDYPAAVTSFKAAAEEIPAMNTSFTAWAWPTCTRTRTITTTESGTLPELSTWLKRPRTRTRRSSRSTSSRPMSVTTGMKMA